jgi:3-mercaptopyruvate sulfurtransferase SseA
MSAEEDCPVCNSSQSAKETFAAARVAEHTDEKARYDDDHEEWVTENTEPGSLTEIRSALTDSSPHP